MEIKEKGYWLPVCRKNSQTQSIKRCCNKKCDLKEQELTLEKRQKE